MKCVRVVISGRVQGVGYRAWTAANARQMELSGWVRNRRDGTVEAVFHGPDEQVQRMIEACKTGPAAAQVDKVEVQLHTAQPEPGFATLPTE